jgi:hypothetical protein
MRRSVTRLVGVYDANGGLLGEAAYVWGKVRGTRHCALCDITHGRVRERADWRACRERLPLPFETFHRDDQPAAVRALTTTLPVVVAESDDGVLSVVADAAALEACAGDPERLVDLLSARLGLA